MLAVMTENIGERAPVHELCTRLTLASYSNI